MSQSKTSPTDPAGQNSANQKFIVGDIIGWKGHPATVREVVTDTPWKYYVIECANGSHILEFSDQSFCEKLTIRKGSYLLNNKLAPTGSNLVEFERCNDAIRVNHSSWRQATREEIEFTNKAVGI